MRPPDRGYGGSVQTFLPYPDFERTAEVLDDRRLGKQRVEVLQILNAIHRPEHYRPLFPEVEEDLPYVWPA
jgi:hypothetical protein